MPLLQQAHAACEAFELEACVSRTTAVVNRTDLDSDQQSRAYQDLAFAYSVIGQIAEAEQFFRLLLRLRPDMQLDESNTAPKIVVVFRKVQAEEQALARALAETERKRLVESIRADVSTVPRGRGGEPLVVTARVQDPRGGVARSVLRYRRGNQGEHSAEPFVAGPSGLSATLSAALTASEQPYNLEYFVELQDTSGQVLRRVGDAAQPLVVPVAAGTPSSPPFWKERRFWLVAGPVAGGGVALLAGVVLVAVAITVSGTVAAWLWSIQPPRGDQGTQRL